MRIYQPLRGVGAAYKENSFVVFDDAGVEIGQGGLEFRVLRKMYEERPLDIEMIMNAHPAASDTLYGALMARAEQIKEENDNLPARLLNLENIKIMTLKKNTIIFSVWDLMTVTAWNCSCGRWKPAPDSVAIIRRREPNVRMRIFIPGRGGRSFCSG